MFDWNKIKRPLIGLSPMAEYTDRPFGLLCSRLGAQVIYREMVSADALVHSNAKTLAMLRIDKAERPVIQQIFGRDPKIMAQATEIIWKTSIPDGIDINMGCPARKVTNNFHGAALMREPKLAQEIIRAVTKATPLPVSVKIRLGWNNPSDALEFAPLLEEAGASAICVHGRTKTQGYAGQADWEMIRRVKEKIKIPVLANGSIFSAMNLAKCLEITQADGALIARGALGNPWIFSQREPDWTERREIILEHAHLQLEHYGEYGLVLLRKHLVHYFKGLPQSRHFRQQIVQIKTLAELTKLLPLTPSRQD